MRKSCTRTASGWPVGRHARPAFLNSPTNSFFFVSTEITGWPAAWNWRTCAVMWRNWASRSGCGGPSRVLRLACKLYPAALKSSRTSWWLTRWPMLCRVRARVRVLFAVQRRGEFGAPEVVGSTSPSRSRSSVGSLSIVRFRPPPGRRTRPGGTRARDRSSLSPRAIVEVEMPVARATRAMPPRPRARASVAAHTRRDRSVSVGASARYFARQPRRSTHSIYPPVAQTPSFIVLRTLRGGRKGRAVRRATTAGREVEPRRAARIVASGRLPDYHVMRHPSRHRHPLRGFMTTTTRVFSLDAKYTQEEGRVFLSGIQALVRLPLDQHRADQRRGLRTATFISGYRGSPLGGFDQTLERERKLLDAHHVVFSSGLNEDLGATAIFGSQMAGLFPRPKYDGVLGMWYGKAPGVDRTGDAFKHANYAGVGKNGGVLALAGDDPVSKSSTLPSASEVALYDALMPTIFPGSAQEILDLGLHGFMLSRTSGLWVGMKIVTNVADEVTTAEVGPSRVSPIIPVVELDGRPFEHQINVNLILPYGLDMERTLYHARLELARRYAWENKLNRIAVPTPDAWLGIMTTGKTYYDVRQALRELGLDDEALRHHGIRILKMAMLFPLEPRIVREFARGLEEVLVVEEKRSFIEMFAKDALYGMPDHPRIVGKQDEEERMLLPIVGELDPDTIARAIAKRLARKLRVESAEARIRHLDELKARPKSLSLARTAYFCSGCPHNRSTVVPEGAVAAAGIGCHGMAMGMDRGIIGITHMGAEGAHWVGIAPFTETPHLFQNIGDGTLFH